MPENKRQHYVHQMHLREWSDDKKNINLVLLQSGLETIGAISKQCQKNYFFGQDMVTDDLVSLFEGSSKPVLNRIVSNHRPPVRWSDDHIDLLMYMMIFSAKTKAEKEKVQKLESDVATLIKNEGLTPSREFTELGMPPHESQISASVKSVSDPSTAWLTDVNHSIRNRARR